MHFHAAVAAYRGRGVVRQIIHEFKYGRQIHLKHLVARWLRAALDDERLRGRKFDVIVPVPLHASRERERGFNQANLIAQLLSAETSIPAKPVLERNMRHALVKALARSVEQKSEGDVADLATLLLAQAQILDGEVPTDPAAFARRLNDLIVRGLRT